MPGHFLKTAGLNREEIDQLIDSAFRFKRGDDQSKPLADLSVALVFFNPSLRTRASMQVGIYELGGNAVVLEPGGTSWTLEHRERVVIDLADVLPVEALEGAIRSRPPGEEGCHRRRDSVVW